MIGLLQRVKQARVEVNGESVGAIEQGILVLLGLEKSDTPLIADKLIDKILAYRMFADAEQKMNSNVQQINGGILVVSQFTLAADTQKGLRPSFSAAMSPQEANALYDVFVVSLRAKYSRVATGIFGADMQVSLVNDGPVTFMLKMQ
jgi:D-tyrosyl-tRNA(Tyr) deacylase